MILISHKEYQRYSKRAIGSIHIVGLDFNPVYKNAKEKRAVGSK
ncbi:hypothetical protein BC749_105224 [Flavobacterium araucananum]|nr:hypothetical protein BC749_105224 [Flavobacterium araucananum]